jgi:hypothetical protein
MEGDAMTDAVLRPVRPVPAVAPPATFLTDAAIGLPEVLDDLAAGHPLIVAGDDPVAMSLGEIALPGARLIWANLRRSSELYRLRHEVEAIALPGRLVLAQSEGTTAAGLTLLQLALAFLPALRARPPGSILFSLPEGEGRQAIAAFIAEIGPALQADGVTAALTAAPPRVRV